MIQEAKGYFYKHFTVYRKSKADQATLFIYPLVGLFSIGVLALYLHAVGSPAGVVPFVIVGVVAWTFYDLCQRSVVYGMLFDVWDWCLKHSIISPASTLDYAIGNSLFGLAGGVFSVLILAVFSIIFFGFNIFSAGITFIAALAIIFVFAVAAGLAIDSIIVAYNKEYMALVWSVPGIVMVFSGVYYPVNLLPWTVQAVAYILPTTYAIDAVRIALGLSSGVLSETLLKGFAASAIYLALFFWVFGRALASARRTGRTISG